MFLTVEKIEKQLKEIGQAIHREVIPIPRFKFLQADCPGAERIDFDDTTWADFQVGETWGGYDLVAWFRAHLTVPPEWRGRKLALHFLVGPRDGGNCTAESLLYVNGRPLQGIDAWHEEAWLPPEVLAEDELLIALKAWSGVLNPPDRRRFKLAQLVWIDPAAERFFYLADTLLKSIKLLDGNDLRRGKLLELLNHAFLAVDFWKPRSQAFYRSLGEAADCLSAGLAHLQVREIKPRVTGVGHSHLDMAWLWRLRHTREKAARTFSTVLHLMRQYPEYRFMHSSPQLYAFLKQDYPEIYARVKERIAAGDWEVTGGMWVEADTNIPGGESLVRQFLLGKRFVREEFGLDMQVLWLPDVFGYPWSLPQIVKKSGMQYFLTSKISWSQFNRFPYDTFFWRGIDGTEMLTHFVTTPEQNFPFYTYNGQLSPAEVKGIWDNYHQKDANDELLLLYGWGDGGGGPTREMLESGRALENVPGLPEVGFGGAEPFFERLARRVSGQELPTWDGELYLEYHRGTYTSQAQNKRLNRQAEILYHDAEWLSALAELVSGQESYPAETLRRGWELILLNQFHDILPGSSIRQVYEDSRQDYEQVFHLGHAAFDHAVERLVGVRPSIPQAVTVFNSLSWERDGLVELPWNEGLGDVLLGPAGCHLSVQIARSGEEVKLLFEVAGIPSLGYRTLPLTLPEPLEARPEMALAGLERASAGVKGQNGGSNGKEGQGEGSGAGPELSWPAGLLPDGDSGGIRVEAGYLENGYYCLRLNPHGQITSIWDKRCGREVLAAGEFGNVFQAFEDKPLNFDAWDTDLYYQEKLRTVNELVDAAVEESGPLRGTLRLVWNFGDSTITQRLRLYRSSPRIDFVTDVDWHEQQVLLKATFPVAIRSTRATYEIQFGSIERPTHWNTSWDWARFEVVGHKWVDLSEGDYGVALLNDCKYGHDVKNNVLRLTLIKSGINPDPQADQGRHVFTYSLLPHDGDWRSGVVNQAYDLNYPLLAALHSGCAPENTLPAFGFAALDTDHVILETVKKAESGEAWIVRLYEYQQRRSTAVHLSFGLPVRHAVECNLVEEDEQPVAYDASSLTFPILPFEIKTFKVWF